MATDILYVDEVLTAPDERCILYTSATSSRHKYVQVLTESNAAFAQLRGREKGSALSFGLLEALDGVEGQQLALQVKDFEAEDKKTRQEKCKCKCGVIARLRVRFLDRTKPPSAVVRGIQRIATQLLAGAVVWNERRSSISWFNCKDRINFVDIEWNSTGSGCCKQLGTITSTSKVELSFVNDPQPEKALQSAVTFLLVDAYLRQIEREMGGVETYARSLLQSILQRLDPREDGKMVTTPRLGALITGLPGVGKTALARSICKSLGVPTIFLNAATIFQTYVGQSERRLVKAFESAVLQSPSILVIDGTEAIAGSRHALAGSHSALELGILGVMLSSLEKVKLSKHRIFVLGTTTRSQDIDTAVISNGRLDQIVNIEPPTQAERLAILRIIVRKWPSDKLDDSFLSQLSESTGGFVGADLLNLSQRALQLGLNEKAGTKAESSALVCPHHFEQALAVTYPSVLQTHHVSLAQQKLSSTSIQTHNHDTTLSAFAGVLGMKDAIQTLRVSLIEPLENCSRFLKFGTTLPKGILLTGPPGSGKTHLANAVAEHVRRHGLASFVSVQCSDLLTKIVGDTERALRQLFTTARNAAPCVLYFDQIESIAPIRGFDTSTEQTFDRMLSMLLVEMDGFGTGHTSFQQDVTSEEARSAFLKQHVVILASTTSKELLDPAILRPGRFDVHIHVDFPDEEARCAMILQALKETPVDYSTHATLDSPEALSMHIAKQTNNLSAGKLYAILREAAMTAMRDALQASTIRMNYVLQALDEATSSPAILSSSAPKKPLFARRHDRKKLPRA